MSNIKIFSRSIVLINRIVLTLACFLSLCGCNSSLFIDEIAPVPGKVSLEADGDSVSIDIQSKGLTYISLYSSYEAETYTTFLDSAGEPLPYNAPFNEVKRIVYSTTRAKLEIQIGKDLLTFIEIDNTYDHPLYIDVCLHYDVVFKDIQVVLAPGKPMVIEDLFFNMTHATHNFTFKNDNTLRVNNNSDTPYTLNIYPYKNVKSSIEIATDRQEDTGISGCVTLPVYKDGEWGYDSDVFVDVTIGKEIKFEPRIVDINTAVPVEIAPNSTAAITTYIRYAVLYTTCNAWCKKPNSEDIILIDNAKAHIYEPIDYHIDIKQ